MGTRQHLPKTDSQNVAEVILELPPEFLGASSWKPTSMLGEAQAVWRGRVQTLLPTAPAELTAAVRGQALA